MSKLTEIEELECRKLHSLYIAKVESDKANNREVLDQAKIGTALGISQSRVSQIMTGYSKVTPENALIFSRLLDCSVKDFSPRINALLSGTPVYQISIIEGSEEEIAQAGKEMAQGITPKLKNGNSISYPGNCSEDVRAFVVDSTAMEPELREGSYAYVDPGLQPSSGESVAIVKDERLIFAQYIGNGTYELCNHKFPDRVFKLKGEDVEVGVVIGTFMQRVRQ
jgi:DNA-binding transcriptional regulator YdaS (Cro superfamily)